MLTEAQLKDTIVYATFKAMSFEQALANAHAINEKMVQTMDAMRRAQPVAQAPSAPPESATPDDDGVAAALDELASRTLGDEEC